MATTATSPGVTRTEAAGDRRRMAEQAGDRPPRTISTRSHERFVTGGRRRGSLQRRAAEMTVNDWSHPRESEETKGGEALLEPVADSGHRWHVLWTHSNCEQSVHDQLAAKGFDMLLPTHESWVRRGGVRRLCRMPMFRGYLFLRHVMDKVSYLEICKARGLVRLLGERWDQLEVVPDPEIAAIERLVRCNLPIFPYPYLREGQRVRITRGPLADVQGLIARGNPQNGLLVVSV